MTPWDFFREDSDEFANPYLWIERFVAIVQEQTGALLLFEKVKGNPNFRVEDLILLVRDTVCAKYQGETCPVDGGDLFQTISRYAEYLLAQTDRGFLKSDPHLELYLASKSYRWMRICGQYLNTPEAGNHGYSFRRNEERNPRRQTLARLMALQDPDQKSFEKAKAYAEALLSGARRIVQNAYPTDAPTNMDAVDLYRPAARYDEIHLEFLSALWCAGFFVGLRMSALSSHVRVVVKQRTSAYPDGVCNLKAVGDVLRASRRRLLLGGPILAQRDNPQGGVGHRVRMWVGNPMVFGWDQYCYPDLKSDVPPQDIETRVSEEERGTWDDEIIEQWDLSPRSFRKLGALYVLVCLKQYTMSGLPLTYLYSRSSKSSVGHGQKALERARWVLSYDGTFHITVPEQFKDELSHLDDLMTRSDTHRYAVYGVASHLELPRSVLGVGRGQLVIKPDKTLAYSGWQADDDFVWGVHNTLRNVSLSAFKEIALSKADGIEPENFDTLDVVRLAWNTPPSTNYEQGP